MDFSNYTQKYALGTTQKFQNLIHKAVLLASFNKRKKSIRNTVTDSFIVIYR